MKLLVLNGPNLNMLGIREPNIYGKESYPQLVKLVEDTCRQLGVEVEVHLSDVKSRDDFRQISYARLACEKTIMSLGFQGYVEAIRYLVDKYQK